MGAFWTLFAVTLVLCTIGAQVLSSISLITEENDILHVMDEQVGRGFTQVIEGIAMIPVRS